MLPIGEQKLTAADVFFFLLSLLLDWHTWLVIGIVVLVVWFLV